MRKKDQGNIDEYTTLLENCATTSQNYSSGTHPSRDLNMENASFLVKLEKELKSSLEERLGHALINDEEDFKDLVNEVCVSLDPDLKRDQVRQSYIGAYRVDFIMWNGLVALEARLVKDIGELPGILSELISHIPAFGGMYRYIVFVILLLPGSIEDRAEVKKRLEEKSDQLRVVMLEK